MNKTKFFSSLLVAVLFASTSVFTSCKDYDDDIKNLQTQIDAKALQTDLTSLKTSLEAQITTLKSTLDQKEAALQAAIEKKADAEDVATLAEGVVTLTANLVALEARVALIEETLAKAATESEAELAKIWAALTGQQDALNKAIADSQERDAKLQEAIDASIETQKKALEAFKTQIAEELAKIGLDQKAVETILGLDARVKAVETAIKGFASSSDLATVKSDMQKLSETINEKLAGINVLELFVLKRVTSLVLKPDFYWEGLAGIEVPYALEPVFTQGKGRTFTYKVNNGTAGDQDVSVKVASAMYYNGKCTELASSETNGYWENTTYQTSIPVWYLAQLDAAAKKDPARTELALGAVANYHVNPITADLEGMNIKFFENDAEVYTRATTGIGATPFSPVFSKDEKNYNEYKNGILAIPFYLTNHAQLQAMFNDWAFGDGSKHYWNADKTSWSSLRDFNYNQTANGNGCELPFLAAQLSKGDTIVTSDYAVVVPAVVDIVALADNDALDFINGYATEFDKCDNAHAVRSNHMYESTGYQDAEDTNSNGAIPMPATHEVAYNDTLCIDFVETHFTYTSYVKYGTAADYKYGGEEQVMSDVMMAALGLHYEYSLVDYTVGANVTGESVHMEQVDVEEGLTGKKSPYFAPRSVTADGKTITGKTATREAIGREPLIRVDLVNEKGEIIRYGYVKIRISETVIEAKGMEVEIDFSDVYFNCGEQLRVTWSQMENLILAKLGEKGLTKEEFETLYFMDVVGNYTNMPYENPAARGVTDPAGTLYAQAAANSWMAKRFVEGKDDKYVASFNANDDAMANLSKYTADNNWFGRVWYTPHDNSTYGHNWDEATNVIVWDLGSDIDADAHNMTTAAWEKLIQVTGASYNSKGLNTKDLSTVIRFVNKMNGSSIWVTLKLSVGKLHFATADINRRVLDHWYDFAEGYKDNTADTIEVYANVPTPALQGNVPLNTYSFKKDLKEYWLEQKVVPTVYNAGKFSKFAAAGALTPEFLFRLPVKGTSTQTIDEKTGLWVNSTTTQFQTGEIKINGVKTKGINYWTVKGASGTTYNLYLASPTTVGGYYGNTIYASCGKATDEAICEITADGVVLYNGYDFLPSTPENTIAKTLVNSAATDILNYIGMYKNDAQGTLQKDTYLDGQDQTFTAYVEIMMNSGVCYDPLMGKNCFNVRFLRPVNMWPAETKWKDAPNATQVYPIWKLVYIRDWRQYAVVPAGLTQQFGAAAVAGTGLDGKIHKGDFAEGNVTYEFYGIENLYVMRDQIRSDAHKAPSLRTIYTDPKDITNDDKTLPITKIPALTGTNATWGKWEFLKIYADQGTEEATKLAAGAAATGLAESASFTDYLAYTNNGGVVKEFHVYVPIALKYPWGSVTDWTQKVWAVITIDPTQGNE